MNERTSGGISGSFFVPAIVAIVSVTVGAWAGALMAKRFAAQTEASAVQETELKMETEASVQEESATVPSPKDENEEKPTSLKDVAAEEEKPGPAEKPWGLAPVADEPGPPAPGPKKAVTDPDHGFNDYESWLAMMQASAVHWDEPTDGQRHPQISMTSGHSVSSPIGQYLKQGEKQVTITISAVIDKEALFEFSGDAISYRPFRATLPAGASGEGKIYPFEGDYPVNVTINGTRWRNLRNNFKLDFIPDLESLAGMEMTQGNVTFLCRSSGRMVLEIFNRGANPTPVQVKLTTKAFADGR